MKQLNIVLILFFACPILVIGQQQRQEKMEQLHFMIGDWVGISTTYKDGAVDQQVPAFQKIKYAVDTSIITIDLHSETLQLHTVIYYDEKAATYYYNPFYKNGAGKFTAAFVDGKLIVTRNATTRFIFQKTSANSFREYGERLENGVWVRYFEDNFKNVQWAVFWFQQTKIQSKNHQHQTTFYQLGENNGIGSLQLENKLNESWLSCYPIVKLVVNPFFV